MVFLKNWSTFPAHLQIRLVPPTEVSQRQTYRITGRNGIVYKTDANFSYPNTESKQWSILILINIPSQKYHKTTVNAYFSASVTDIMSTISTMTDWVRLNVPPTHYRSYGDRYTKVNQKTPQCILTKEYIKHKLHTQKN